MIATADIVQPWWLVVLVALIPALGGIAAAWIAASTRRENREQHGENASKLDEVISHQKVHADRLRRVDEKVERVIGDVAEVRERTAALEAHAGDRTVGTPARRLEVVVEPLDHPPA